MKQYHKLPKKSSSKTDLSKHSGLRGKKKSSKKTKKGQKNENKSHDDRLNDAEFKKLEEQVKNKFPELFVS